MQNIWQHIYAAFIEADRWKLYLKGLGVTLEVSFFAALLGILIGTIAAFLKLSTRKNGSKTIASRIASAYIDIIRGTPTTVQFGGTSSITTLPAPIFEFSPTVKEPMIFAPALTITLSSKVG